MTMPNFLVIGAMKSGTTALYYYLDQHPQVYMSPVKEPSFFAYKGESLDARESHEVVSRTSITDIERYRELFEDATDEKAVGEASHWYLYSPRAPERIKHHVPGVGLIAVLRNPVERAYSHFLHAVRNGDEPIDDFARALQEEETRGYWDRQHYVDKGFYHAQLERYFGTFDRTRIKIYLYEDLNTNPAGVMQDAFGFLGVDEAFVPDVSQRRNVSGIPRSKTLDTLLTRPNPIKQVLKLYLPLKLRRRIATPFDKLKTRNLARPPQLPSEVRRELIEVYREDVSKLQNLIGRDLSKWLE